MTWDPVKYTVGWVCAINAEGVAARLFLDETHDPPPSRSENDCNNYSLGRIGKHNVVIASLPDGEYGLVSAAIVARDMLHAFPKVRIGLLVGVAGGAPSDEHDVRLGDVVINSRETLQYDYGKEIQDQPFLMTGHLNRPPIVLRTAVSTLRNDYTLMTAQGRNPIEEAVEQVLHRYPNLRKTHSRPDDTTDRLFRSDFLHGDSGLTSDQAGCSSNAYNLARRKERRDAKSRTEVHYGTIASANRLMKDATTRDRIAKNDGVLCFEMEATGLVNHFPCLIIRGICDYSDTHKNKEWQGFASLVAAACARDLLGRIALTAVEDENPIADTLKAMTAQTRLKEVKEWLNPADPSTNFNDARKVRYRDTGEWLLKSHQFREWEDGDRRQLWLHGMQGCGKTVLAYTIIERVAAKTDGDGVIVRVFFDCRDPTKQSFDSMVRSLLYQLYCSGDEAECDAIYRSLDGKMKEGQPPTDFLMDSLHAALKVRRNPSIVLDALDECSRLHELLNWLTALVKDASLGHVKIVATSRPEDEFKQTMRVLIGEEGCVALSSEDIKADIRSYVQGSLKQRTGFEKWSEDPGVLHRIAKVVTGKADGMFRFAACLLDRLERCPDIQSLEDVLKSVPRDLADIYEKILEQLPREGDLRDRIIRLLQFLVYSNQQLSLDEAVDIVAVQQRGFKKAYRMRRKEHLKGYCSSLVTESIGTRPDGKTLKILKVAHSSVRDYLLETHPETFAEQESYKVIALTCLAYLTSIEEAAGPQDVKRDYHLADYAAQYWMEYVRLSEASEEVVAAATEFLSDKRLLKLWAGLYDKPKAEVRGTALYYSCQNNLPRLSQRLIQATPEELDMHADGEYGYGYPLQAAAREGHLEIVRLLLDSKANINNVGGAYGTALQAACRWHQKDVVELMLSRKGNPNIQAGCDWNALHAAITGPRPPVLMPGEDKTVVATVVAPAEDSEESPKTDVEIVKLLLEKGAEPNADGRYGSALGVALHKNRADLANLLLDHGADANLTMMYNLHTDADGTVTCDEYTPLFLAVSFRMEFVVQRLLEKKANMDVGYKNGRKNTVQTPLEIAKQCGYWEIVDLLEQAAASHQRNSASSAAVQSQVDPAWSPELSYRVEDRVFVKPESTVSSASGSPFGGSATTPSLPSPGSTWRSGLQETVHHGAATAEAQLQSEYQADSPFYSSAQVSQTAPPAVPPFQAPPESQSKLHDPSAFEVSFAQEAHARARGQAQGQIPLQRSRSVGHAGEMGSRELQTSLGPRRSSIQDNESQQAPQSGASTTPGQHHNYQEQYTPGEASAYRTQNPNNPSNPVPSPTCSQLQEPSNSPDSYPNVQGYQTHFHPQNVQYPQATNLGQSYTPAQTHQTQQAQSLATSPTQTQQSSSPSHNYHHSQGYQNQGYQPHIQPQNLQLQQAANPVRTYQPPQTSNPTPAYQMQQAQSFAQPNQGQLQTRNHMQRTQSQPNSYKYQQQAAAQAPQAQQGATKTGYYPTAQFQQHTASQGVAASGQTLQIPQTAHHRVQMNHTGPVSTATHQGQGYNLQQGQQQYPPSQGPARHPQPQRATGVAYPSQTTSQAASYGAYPTFPAAYQPTTDPCQVTSTAQQGQGYNLQQDQQQQQQQQQQHNTLSPYANSQNNWNSQPHQHPYNQAGQVPQAQVANPNTVQTTTQHSQAYNHLQQFAAASAGNNSQAYPYAQTNSNTQPTTQQTQTYPQTQQQYQTLPAVNGQAISTAHQYANTQAQYPNAQTQYPASQAAFANNQTYQATGQQLPSNQAASNGFQPQNPQTSQWQQPGYQQQPTWNVNNTGWRQQ
ncbi:ankryin repeat protein [Colletotrichum musicola]|uniref:Ankryin repeat protein n=1 Tax=Colletotrichum musicola TaxID=2175873 RepID=A0A8H6KQ12_9PEZI|nr:ankryin repeat protein [Colletotrichum musicola]